MAKKFKFTKSGIIILVIIMCYFFSGLFTLGTFNKPVKYFYAEQIYSTENIQVDILLNYEDEQELDEIWINTGNIEVNEGNATSINFKYSSYVTSSGTTLGTSSISGVGLIDSNLFNWTNLYSDLTISSSNKYIMLTFNNDMQVNELVFLDKQGALISASVVDDTQAEGYISPLFDEQDTFTKSVSFKNNVTQSESYTLCSVISYLNTRSYVIDGEANALGVIIIAQGVKMFGVNTLGLRIMPFLFSTAIILLLYLIGKKLFNKKWLALLFSGMFVLSGFAFSVGRVGSVIPICTFFILLSFMFIYEFYNTAINKSSVQPTIKYLVLSALFFIIALGISTLAIFGLFGIIAIFIVALLKQRVLFKKSIAKNEDQKLLRIQKFDYNYKIKVDYLVFFASFIIAPVFFIMMFYLPMINSLSISYDSTNIFNIIIKDITYFFSFQTNTAYTAGNSSSFISWLFNYRTTVLFADTSYTGTEAVAVIFNSVAAICSFVSLILISSFVIKYIFSSRVSKKDFKIYNANIKQYVFLILGLICFIVPFAFIKSHSNNYFYIGSIFYTAFICLYLNSIDSEKKILTNYKGGIAVTNFIAIVVISLIFINFLMVMPLYFGIPVSASFERAIYWITSLKPNSFIR